MVALTLAAAAERVDKVELVWVDPDDLQQDGIGMNPSAGRTPVASMADEHVDAVHLDLVRLGLVARHVARALAEKRYRRWTKAQVRRILVAAVEDKRVALDHLDDRVREEVRAALEKKRKEAAGK